MFQVVGWDNIVWTALYEPTIAHRDQSIKTSIEDVGIIVHIEHGYLLHRPDQVSVAGGLVMLCILWGVARLIQEILLVP